MQLSTFVRHLPRKCALAGLTSALALAVALPVTAMTTQAAPATSASSATSATASACDLACVQAFGNQRIAERISALNTLNSKVTTQLNLSHITQSQAAPIQGDVTGDISGLQALQTKLDGETEISVARADVKSIYTQFRIYAVVLPRDYRELALDLMLNVDAKLRGVQGSLESAIDAAPANEQAQLNALFADFKAKLQEGEGQIDGAQGQIAVLTPANYNNARSTYESALTTYKTDEQSAHENIKAAAGDLHQIAHILHGGNA